MPFLIPANTLFGLLAALFWGGGDFSGGMAANRAGGGTGAALRVILLSHSASLCTLTALALMRGDTFPHGAALAWGLAAGVTGGLSLTLFYIALARGAIAIWIVAAAPTGVLESPAIKPAASTLPLAITAGAGFGVYFIALKHAGAAGVLWPMATARIGSITTCSVLVLMLSMANRNPTGPVAMPKSAIHWALSTALLDTCGNLLFLSATRAGRLDIAAVLASLYPATTILLAGIVLKERLSRRQGLGMAIAAAAVVMITL
jgi:uncharacterized membrane protein